MKAISLILSLQLLFGSFPVPLSAQAADREYFVEAGDVISITVFPAEEFSKEVTVQPDGTVEVPLLGSFRVEGMKVSDLQKMLTAKFSKYVASPEITLNVRKFASNKIAIIGRVKASGYFEYREGMKLLDLVAQAGGAADYAKTDKVRIYRRVKNAAGLTTEEVLKADLKAVLDGDMTRNIVLASGDIVYVPEKRYYSAGKWIGDNFMPYMTLFTFAITLGIVMRKN